jgi:hypothetical protein
MVCNSLTQGIENQLVHIKPYDPDGGALFLVLVDTLGGGRCSQLDGWAVTPVDQAGNVLSADIAYLSTVGANPSATATSTIGVAVIYNLDPSVGYAELEFTDTYADAGPTTCVIETPSVPFTASLPIEAGRFADAIYQIY